MVLEEASDGPCIHLVVGVTVEKLLLLVDPCVVESICIDGVGARDETG